MDHGLRVQKMTEQAETEARWAEQLRRTNRWHNREKVALLVALKKRFGSEVVTVVGEVIAERAQRYGSMIAQRQGGSSIEDLLRLLWEPERANGLEYTIERRADGVQIRCTRCPMCDLAREIDSQEWMYHLVCAADPHIASGFNPKIGLRRTTTVMEGHDSCDHFYFMKE
jgi:predicted ArsR family transcriptional regulator